MSTMPVPPSGKALVMPGPWGAPSHTGGGAFGIMQLCWSKARQAGLPPIRTVVAHAPISGEPCMVVSESLAAGLGMAVACRRDVEIRLVHDPFYSEERMANDGDRISWIDELKPLESRESVVGSGHRAFDDDGPAARIANLHAVSVGERRRQFLAAGHQSLRIS